MLVVQIWVLFFVCLVQFFDVDVVREAFLDVCC